MAEYVRDIALRQGAPGALANPASLRTDLSILLATFLGDVAVNQAVGFNEHNPLSKLWNEFTEDAILARLASTASLLRARDDYLKVAVEENDANPNNEYGRKLRARSCGALQPDIDARETIDLTLREACNKIMHATKCNFDIVGKYPVTWLGHTVYLYGTYNKVRWRAELNIIKYVEVGAAYTEFL